MVLHNGAKFVSNKYPKKDNSNNFSITQILQDLNWSSLEERRIQARLIMAFKILNDHVILKPNVLPKPKSQRPERLCRGIKVGAQHQLFEPQARLDVNQSTFFFITPQLWNYNVTPKQANAKTVDTFRRYFKNQ